jgi:hypothetical protein
MMMIHLRLPVREAVEHDLFDHSRRVDVDDPEGYWWAVASRELSSG